MKKKMEPAYRPDRLPGYHKGMVGVKMFRIAGTSVGQDEVAYDPGRYLAYLDHSCDEWVIGGTEQIKQLIGDLTAILGKTDKTAAP